MSFIQPTSSLYSILVLFVKKKDGSLHLYINFCSLNYISKKDCYPLLLISNLLNLSCKAQVYIKTCYRSFKQSVMPFGLTNALMTFQQFINDVFSSFLNVCVIIYLDDILIYSNNMFKHHWHVKEVLMHLCKTSFYIKVEKCKFYSKLVEYLGYILSFSSLTMSNNKVKIIQDWPESKKVKDI